MSGVVVLILRIFILAALYGFLVWALLTLWRDLRAQGQLLSNPHIPTLVLTPLDGELDGERAFNSAEVVLGRSTSSECPIDNATVSSRHARLSYHHNQWWLEDLSSTNGTFLNDERVSMPTVIVAGDELRVGKVSMLISIQDKA